MQKVLKHLKVLLAIVSSLVLMACANNEPSLVEQRKIYGESQEHSDVNNEELENLEQQNAHSKSDAVNAENISDIDNITETKILIKIGEQSFTGILYENDSTKVIVEMLPLTLNMADLNRNEKFFNFDASFPSKAVKVQQIYNGDLMLYGSNCLVLFYESFITMYSYTPLGHVENPEQLKEALGKGNVEVTFSIE